jgi:dTDP-4-amino-4,6-dideoxygalactose transaminase
LKIPPLNMPRQIAPLRSEIDAAIGRVIDQCNFILGKEVSLFEDEVCAYTGSRYAVGVSNGTDSLRLSLAALGIKPGEGVVCPSFTYYATAGAVSAMGAVPIFTDIDPHTYTITAAHLKEALKRHARKKITAVIPVHLYGLCADMDPLRKVCREHGLKIVEDTAQAFGAKYKGRYAGTLGDCGSVSFFPAKNLGAFGDAGMVLTSKAGTAKTLRILRNQGNRQKYFHTLLGSNNRMDTLQAAVLRVKLKYLDGSNRARQENAAFFDSRLAGEGIEVPAVPEYTTHIYQQDVVKLPCRNLAAQQFLVGKGIDARIFYPLPLHLQPCFKYLGYRRGDFPEAEKASKHVLALPVDPTLTMEEKEYIVAAVKEYFHTI